jgi:hypothetical protein
MRCEINGEMPEVQASIERALEIIRANNSSHTLVETAIAREYVFNNKKLGEIGRVKISILPERRTELYSYPADFPSEKWLLEYLSSHVPQGEISKSLRKLLSLYTWQIENRLFNLHSTELFKLAHAKTPADFGW